MGKTRGQTSVRTIAMLGNHLPRHCGIATFTTDLSAAIGAELPDLDCFVVAMNDVGVRHAYPPRVRFEIPEGDIEAYRRAADFLNVNSVDVVSVQHEYGIFGGKAGGHLLELLRGLRMPVVTTLHTVLAQPDPVQRAVLEAVVRLSERVVVMSADGAALLESVHGVPRAKIDVIPHGIPAMPAQEGKARLRNEDRQIILTFGLLSPDKGLEYVIDAMPAILAKHANTDYLVLGATHPHVKQQHGEAYRQMLQLRAERLGVAANVIFHNRFVSHEELVEFLGAADVYVTPYLKEEQSTSGTLAYAVGGGKAVISTPYRYARELLAEGRGVLVPWRDGEAIGREINRLLDHPAEREALQQRAADFGRRMGWPLVARSYVESFTQAHRTFTATRGALVAQLERPRSIGELPEIDLSHVRLMTDDTGMLQHALFYIPRYGDGYCVDDNARALLLLTLVEEAGTEAPETVRALANRYLAFINHAFDESSGRFRNFLSYARTWRDERSSDDSHGRALWALGTVLGRSTDPGRRGVSSTLLHAALPQAATLSSLRGAAYALLGLDEYLRAFSADCPVQGGRATLATRLMEGFQRASGPRWPWFEERLTYCNARLPQALLAAGSRLGNPAMVDTALSSLEWLVGEHVGPVGTFAPVGTNGFHERGGARAMFDQQPVEACAMVGACLEAHRVTGETRWLDRARWAFQWFLGQNSRQAQVYDTRTGGCRDGLHFDRLNENQGAESTLSFLIALAELRAADRLAPSLLPATSHAALSIQHPRVALAMQETPS
jgi:glycosyltransferase involved in cell wall biosynthesis